MVFIAVLLYFK